MGKFTWPESAEYEGEVRHGRREGQGTLRFEGSCSSYEGEWRRGLRHGQGGVVFPEHRPSRPATKVSARPPAETNTLASPGKATGYYQGGWEDDLRHGQGTIVYPTGSCYVGEWHSGDKQGQWRMEWADSGQVYEGEWDKGLPTGWGTLVYGAARGGGARAGEGARAGAPPPPSSGGGPGGLGSEFRDHLGQRNCYVGQFRNGVRHGVGTFYYSTGAHYSGDWKDNVKSGRGIFTFENGTVFEGRFENDRPVDGPLTQGASMQLAVDDILAEEVGGEQQLRAVINLLLRYNSELRDTYRYYSDMSEGVEKPEGGMSWGQFLRMCKDSRIPCRVLSSSRIERMVADVCARAALHGMAPGAKASGPRKFLLCRIFLESLVRAAHITYNGMGQLERRIHQLLNNNILPHAGGHRRSTPLPDSRLWARPGRDGPPPGERRRPAGLLRGRLRPRRQEPPRRRGGPVGDPPPAAEAAQALGPPHGAPDGPGRDTGCPRPERQRPRGRGLPPPLHGRGDVVR